MTDKRLDIRRGGQIDEILLSEGTITRDQLEEARKAHPDGDLGQILLSLGFINQIDLAKALARRLRLRYVEITEQDVDREATTLLHHRFLRKRGVVPLRIENG